MKLAAAVLLFAVVGASPELRYFRYQRPVENLPRTPGQTCLALDPAIFPHAAPQLADLRLYRGNIETPYVLRIAARQPPSPKSIAPLNLGKRNGDTVFDAQLPAGGYSDLQLSIAAQNFIATVFVSGAQTQSHGTETSLGHFTIFDFTRQKLGRSTVLHLPESNFPSLHFRISGPLPPAAITGLFVVPLPAGQPRFVTVAETSRFEQKNRKTLMVFTTPAHVPVDRVLFAPAASAALFSRNVTIDAVSAAPPASGGAETPPPAAATGNLLHIHSVQDGKRIDEERLAIDAPAIDSDTPVRWTVTIDNADDTPLALESVRLQMAERTLCFAAELGAAYTLDYGDPVLAAPRYDYAALFTPQARPALSSAGPETPNPAFQPRPDNRPFTEKHPALLWIALLAVVALLAVIALRSARSTA